ncbi:MAG: YhcG family protein [Candidatus Margulisiibacteriota bacterium]
MNNNISKENSYPLFTQIRDLITHARTRVASTINQELVALYWAIGQHIRQDILNSDRAEYGKQVIATLSQRLTEEFGKGWSERQLHYCLKFADIFPEKQILNTVCAKLSWSHLRLLLPIEDELKRSFYIELCKLENWSSRQLQERIQSMLYERTAISKKPDKTISQDLQVLREQKEPSSDIVFRDPYFLDFLGLSDTYSEKDLESSIIHELERFIIELGQDFAFLARQKRISIDNRDYYIDLLFYHRRLKCLVAIDLKIGEFEAGFKGQMELYLRYLEKHEMVSGENQPIGLILCAGKNKEHIELMQLDKSNIRVAEYLTQLPSKDVLQTKLHQAIEIARHRLLDQTEKNKLG